MSLDVLYVQLEGGDAKLSKMAATDVICFRQTTRDCKNGSLLERVTLSAYWELRWYFAEFRYLRKPVKLNMKHF